MKIKIHSIILLVLAINFSFFSVILLENKSTKNQLDIKCITENNTRKVFSSGNVVISELTTLIFLYKSAVTIIQKGAIADKHHQYRVDRTLHFAIRNIGNSNIYHVYKKKSTIMPNDNVPGELFENVELDGIDYFYVTNAFNNAYIIHGLVLPIATCSTL